MVRVKSKGDFKNTFKFLETDMGSKIRPLLDSYGQRGVEILKNATPVESGESAACWGYEIINDSPNRWSIEWYNTHVTDEGTPIVILIQYGHNTGAGTYCQGIDFINPAMKPLFDDIAKDMESEVKNL